MGPLRREVMVPVASYRRPSSLIGISVVLVLLASAVDTVVWTYQARRELQRDEIEMTIPSLSHTDVAAVRARAREAELNRAEAELRQIDQQVLERLRQLSDDQQTAIDRARREAIESQHLTCDPADPLCGLE